MPLGRIATHDLEGDARAIADRLNARLDKLAGAEKEQIQFIADVSHELRTPLTVLRGSLEVALEEERSAEEYREAIGNALLEEVIEDPELNTRERLLERLAARRKLAPDDGS